MATRERKEGGAQGMIDQILTLSHRQIPAERLAVTHRRDTANTRFMRQAAFYARCALEKGQEPAAREAALAVFAAQEKAGHMSWPGDDPDALGYKHRVEQMAADPHYGFHLGAVGLITLAASWWRHADVYAKGEDWLRRHLAVLQRCSAPDGQTAFPCTRARTNPPLWDVATGVLREAMRLPHQGPLARKPWLPDRQGWWVPIRLVRLLAEAGADLKPRDGELPYLRIPMQFARHGWGYLATMGPVPHLRWIGEPVDWVLMRYDAKRIDYGRSWTKAPPRVSERGPIET